MHTLFHNWLIMVATQLHEFTVRYVMENCHLFDGCCVHVWTIRKTNPIVQDIKLAQISRILPMTLASGVPSRIMWYRIDWCTKFLEYSADNGGQHLADEQTEVQIYPVVR